MVSAASETLHMLQALALLDGAAGDGGEFWQHYTQALLPQPEELTLPLCWDADMLRELQHPAIINAAQAQQVRSIAHRGNLLHDLLAWPTWPAQ
jgi:hypothetical protein